LRGLRAARIVLLGEAQHLHTFGTGKKAGQGIVEESIGTCGFSSALGSYPSGSVGKRIGQGIPPETRKFSRRWRFATETQRTRSST
jgi:hypothetical protein